LAIPLMHTNYTLGGSDFGYVKEIVRFINWEK